MSDIAVLDKILDLRTQEKNEALLNKKLATEQFEQVAQELYVRLKTREDAETILNTYIQSEAVITKIRDQIVYIDGLNNKINALQEQVNIARKKMEEKQAIVTNKYIEVKKIEKMIEKRKLEEKAKEAQSEMKLMDEISLNQYMRAK